MRQIIGNERGQEKIGLYLQIEANDDPEPRLTARINHQDWETQVESWLRREASEKFLEIAGHDGGIQAEQVARFRGGNSASAVMIASSNSFCLLPLYLQ